MTFVSSFRQDRNAGDPRGGARPREVARADPASWPSLLGNARPDRRGRVRGPTRFLGGRRDPYLATSCESFGEARENHNI